MPDHLNRATEWLDLVRDCHVDGHTLSQAETIAAAATHALAAIAESLRSGTIERTETVAHVRECSQETPESPRTAQEPEHAPTATPEPERPQEGLTAAGLDALPPGSVVTADHGCATWIRHPYGDWVSDESEGALTSDELARFSNGPVMLEHRPPSLADDEVIVKLTPEGGRMNKMMWVDIETNGLNVTWNDILEIGLVVTDGDLNIVDHLEVITKTTEDMTLPMELVQMHTDSGLVRDWLAAPVRESGDILNELKDFYREHHKDAKVPMCGSSISFDRAFLAESRYREFEDLFHYRNVDVSSIKEIRRSLGQKLYDSGREKAHRPVADLEESIAELRYYLTEWGQL